MTLGVTLKSVALVAVPPAVVTLILPVTAFSGTSADIDVTLLTVNTVSTPLNVTDVVPPRFKPVMVISEPTGAAVGAKELITGPAAYDGHTITKSAIIIGQADGLRVTIHDICELQSGCLEHVGMTFVVIRRADDRIRKLTADDHKGRP